MKYSDLHDLKPIARVGQAVLSQWVPGLLWKRSCLPKSRIGIELERRILCASIYWLAGFSPGEFIFWNKILL